MPRLLDPAAAAAWTTLVAAVADRAAPCSISPESWYADDPDVAASAARVCIDACPVLAQCARYADAAGERHGVWAGVDRTRRRRTVPAQEVVA